MVFQFELNQHLFSKFSLFFCLFTFNSYHINQSFELWDISVLKISIDNKLKISYIIRLVIIKHVLVREVNDTLVQYDDIKP
jgi:hypothetical protein